MTPDRIRERAAAIRLPVKHLASTAGVDEDTAHRILKGTTDPRTSTLHKLANAVLLEEQRLRQHLADIETGNQEAVGSAMTP